MKNTQKGFIVPLLIAIIAVLAIGGGIYLYTQNKPQSVTQQQATNNQVVSTSSTQTNLATNQIAGWNTYKNFGIEFQYPKSSVGSIPREIITPSDIYIVVPGVTVNIYNGTDIGNATNVDGNRSTSRKISVGGKTATEITELINGISVVRYDFSINFTANNKTISFGGVEIDPSSAPATTQQQKDALYKIASTFGTYNASQAPINVDTGWSIYKNYGIEFEYPKVASLSGTDIYGISQIKITVAEQNDPNNGIGSNGCEVMPNNPALQTSQVTINNMKFCLGSAMTANDTTGYPYFYDYTFLKDGEYYTVSYSLSSPDPTNKSSIIKQVEKSISTLNIGKSPSVVSLNNRVYSGQSYSFSYPSGWAVWEANPYLGLAIVYPEAKSQQLADKTISSTDEITVSILNGQPSTAGTQSIQLNGQSWIVKNFGSRMDGGTENGLGYYKALTSTKYVEIVSGLSNKKNIETIATSFVSKL